MAFAIKLRLERDIKRDEGGGHCEEGYSEGTVWDGSASDRTVISEKVHCRERCRDVNIKLYTILGHGLPPVISESVGPSKRLQSMKWHGRGEVTGGPP